MSSREDKLKKLAKSPEKRPETPALTIDANKFIEALDTKINELREVLSVDIQVDLSELIGQLKQIDSLSAPIDELQKAISAIEVPDFPKSVKIEGLDEIKKSLGDNSDKLENLANTPMTIRGTDSLEESIRGLNIPETIRLSGEEHIVEAIKSIKVPNAKVTVDLIDNESAKEIISKLGSIAPRDSISKVVDKLDDVIKQVSSIVYKGAQDTSDFIPVRRVIKVGNALIFDDARSGSGGGGGGGGIAPGLTRLNETAIAIVNPDGTNVNGGTASSFDHGSNLDVDTSAEQLTSTSFATSKGVSVIAPSTNTGIVYVGNNDVTAGTNGATDGFPIYPGDSVTIEVDNPNKLYVIGSANNQAVFWMAV